MLKCPISHLLKANNRYEMTLGTPTGQIVSQNSVSFAIIPQVTINKLSPDTLFLPIGSDTFVLLSVFGDFTAIKELGSARFTFRLVNNKNESAILPSSLQVIGGVADIGRVEMSVHSY